jgi:hypothetical protein
MWPVFISATVSSAIAQEDHPLVSRHEGSKLTSKKVEEFGEYTLVTGRTVQGDFVGKELKGKVTWIVYQSPQGRSTSTR